MTTTTAVVIEVERFQPFRSRIGVDEVVGLRFDYDAHTVSVLKAALADARAGGHPNPGGWLPRHGVWFVEPAAWPAVRATLTGAGFTLDEPPDPHPRLQAGATGDPLPPRREWLKDLRERLDRGLRERVIPRLQELAGSDDKAVAREAARSLEQARDYLADPSGAARRYVERQARSRTRSRRR